MTLTKQIIQPFKHIQNTHGGFNLSGTRCNTLYAKAVSVPSTRFPI